MSNWINAAVLLDSPELVHTESSQRWKTSENRERKIDWNVFKKANFFPDFSCSRAPVLFFVRFYYFRNFSLNFNSELQPSDASEESSKVFRHFPINRTYLTWFHALSRLIDFFHKFWCFTSRMRWYTVAVWLTKSIFHPSSFHIVWKLSRGRFIIMWMRAWEGCRGRRGKKVESLHIHQHNVFTVKWLLLVGRESEIIRMRRDDEWWGDARRRRDESHVNHIMW